MKTKRAFRNISKQDSLSPDSEAFTKRKAPLAEVMNIAPNVCLEKGDCSNCDKGSRYGIPLHFILHYLDGKIGTVCYTCGKNASNKTGLKLPPTESNIEAKEEESDLRLIRIAESKKGEK